MMMLMQPNSFLFLRIFRPCIAPRLQLMDATTPCPFVLGCISHVSMKVPNLTAS